MKLYFVRHTSVDVEKGICYGQSNVPVNISFEAEAEIVKSKLKDIPFDIVYSSPLGRCRKLAKFCGYDNVEWRDRLKEMNFGEWEMMPWDDIEDDNLDLWYKDWIHSPATGGESFKMQYDRVASIIDEIKAGNYKNAALFTHAGVISCARIYFGETTFEKAFENQPDYGEIVCFEI